MERQINRNFYIESSLIEFKDLSNSIKELFNLIRELFNSIIELSIYE